MRRFDSSRGRLFREGGTATRSRRAFAASGSPSKVLAQPDFAPQPGQEFSKTGRVSQWVLIIPGILFGLIVLTPILVITIHRLRDRKVRRSRAEADRRRVFRNLPERPN